MKKIPLLLSIGFVGLLSVAAIHRSTNKPDGFLMGTPEIKSINALAFGPDGILFIGDSKSAAIIAIDTKDVGLVEKPTAVEIKNFDQNIAAY